MLLTNATLVLPDALLPGTVLVDGGLIADIQPGRSAAAATDCEGDFLLPGIVDLHTDNLERQVQPRSRTRWPSRSALLAHDAHCVAAGITTVFDSLCVGDLGFDENRARTCAEGIADLTALVPTGLLRAEHFLHLRCELPAPGMPALFDAWAEHPLLRLVSLMDHTPGGGQYADLARYRAMRARDGEGEAETASRTLALQAQRAQWWEPNRRALLARLAGTRAGLAPVLASHDDRTPAEIARNVADGVMVSEFPVTREAAAAARAAGMTVVSGAPNVVRGGSHTGNVAASELIAAGLVDALASDYVPASLLDAVFRLAAGGMALPRAVALASAGPARLAGLHDRGALVPGLRADLLRVALFEGQPMVRCAWREGVRVL